VDKPKRAARRIQYVASPIEMVEDFAGRVCRKLADRSGNPRLTDAGTIKGFAAFLRVLFTIQTAECSNAHRPSRCTSEDRSATSGNLSVLPFVIAWRISMPHPASTSKPQQSVVRNVALCYVRQSVTRNLDDRTSPERPRANIQAAYDRYGWVAEWYENASGHKSATKEENRPAWIALKSRLKDGDVVAIVVNEQSCAMRNVWRAIKLFEGLPAYVVKLHLAGLDRTIDITTPDGSMSAYMQAFLDDLYALDASRRAKDSVQYRYAKGETIGIPPFGTTRVKRKLVPSSQGRG